MSKEFIKENNIAQVRYTSQEECLADKSKETREFLNSTPAPKAKVEGGFVVARKTKRGKDYLLIYCNDYNIEFESGNIDEQTDLTLKQISVLFNPEVSKACDMIYNISDRKSMNLRDLKKIYKNGISRARKIEYLDSFDMTYFYRDFLPEFMKTNSCRTKVFITPNLRSKIGV